MSMTLNYNYYGIPTGRYIYCDWDNDIHVADIVNDNLWNLYRTQDNQPIVGHWGKPLDDSVYLWKLKPDCSYARNAAFCADNSSTLNIVTAEHIEQQPVAFTVSCVDRYTSDYGELSTYPHNRLADDDTKAQGALYNSLAYNIPYTSYCIHAQSGCFDAANNTISQQNMNNIPAYINADPDNRDVLYINPILYVGTDSSRKGYTAIDGLYRSSDTNKSGAVLPDVLTYRPIPDNATYIKNEIISGMPEGANWRTDSVYNPFYQAIGQNNYFGSGLKSAVDYQMRIGLQQYINYSDIRNGKNMYINVGENITGQFYKASSATQFYDDVVFRWVLKIYDVPTGKFIDNGFDITGRSSGCRICTVLDIVDAKGQTKGEACKRAVMHEIAAIGFYFTNLASAAQSYVLGGDGDYSNVFLPEIIGGITTGNYVTGDDVKDVPYFNATDVSDFKYNPEALDYDSGDLTTHIKTGGLADGALWYRMNFVEISLLTQWLNTTYKPDSSDLTEDFKGVNPCEYIISVKYFPFNVPYSNTESDVSIGGIDVGFDAPTVSRQYGVEGVSYFSLGSFTMQPPYCFGNFLDKYLKIQIYIPYCGFAELDSAVYCPSPDGTIHTIRAALQVDYATGQCVGLIYRDNLLIDTMQGNCGVDLPLSAIQQGSYQNNIKQAELAIKQAKAGQLKSMLAAGGAVIGTAAAAFTGNVAGVLLGTAAAVSSVQGMKTADISRESADYNLEHTAPNISGIESASPFNAMIQEDTARIFIYKPVLLQGADLAAYATTTGYACCKQGKLSSFKGLTVCSSSQLNFDAPAAHKTQLQQMLAKGVYV